METSIASAAPRQQSPLANLANRSPAQPARSGCTTYKLRTGEVVQMSKSQYNIANRVWRTATPQEIATYAAQITVTIIVEKNDGGKMLGTGFFNTPNQVLTNWHVVRGAKSITVIDSKHVKYDATVRFPNQSMDVTSLNVPGANSKFAWFATDSDWEQVGEKVYIYGNPQGFEGTFSQGMLSSLRANGAILQIAAPLDHGNSGSPVFNEYGLVIGIVCRKVEDSSAELNFAISTNAMFEAVQMINSEHPKGFNLGITVGLELRNQEEIAADTVDAPQPSIKNQIEAFKSADQGS